MRMYVANTTKQICAFHYRVSEFKGTRQQKIPPGQQVMLADSDLTEKDITYIVEQHSRFGLMKAEEVSRDRRSGIIPRIYSVDKPISALVIEAVMRRNTTALIVKGKEARRLAAIQASNNIEDQLRNISEQTQGNIQPTLNELDVSVEQVSDPRAPFTPSDEQPERIEEGTLVKKDAPREPTKGRRSNRRNVG